MTRNPDADAWMVRQERWRTVLEPVRDRLLASGMDETIKWGIPVYTVDGRNVAGLAAFRDFAAVWFFQGALLSDPDERLVNAQPGKTRAQRQWRIAAPDEIDLDVLDAWIEEAVRNEREGRRVPARTRAAANDPVPDELSAALDADAALAAAYEKLTPGRRRAYAAYIGDAKRAATRQRRLQKCLPMIRAGQGLDDRYRK